MCGNCGARMSTRYRGSQGQYPSYMCNEVARELAQARCQEIKALEPDALVEPQILQALEADKLAIALATFEQLEKQDTVVEHQWLLKIERAKYEATRAQRQYDSVDPENRLVARNLEKHWEKKLRELEHIEKEYENWSKLRLHNISAETQQQLLVLGENLPKIWYADTTTNADRKRIVRLLIKDVIIDKNRQRGKVWVQINWQTQAITQHWIKHRPTRYKEMVETNILRQRLGELKDEGAPDLEIVRILNDEGYQAIKGVSITRHVVFNLRQKWNIEPPKLKRKKASRLRWEDGTYTLQGAASVIGVHLRTIHTWIERGMLDAHQNSKHSNWKITLTEEKIAQLKAYLLQARRLPKPLETN